MRTLSARRPSAVFLLCALCAAVSSPLTAARAQEDFAIVPEVVLRRLAKKTPMPAYPESSRRRGAKGRAVAELDVDKAGNLTRVRLIEATDADIERAVTEAVNRWEFSPASAGEGRRPVRVRGKLTFYFEIEGGKALVRNPRKFN